MNHPTPLIVLGLTVRSGTNMLARLAACHPAVQFVPPGSTTAEFPLLRTLERWDGAYESLAAKACSTELFDAAGLDRWLGRALLEDLAQRYELGPGPVFLKDPAIFGARRLVTLLPTAQIVTIRRDGRDTVVSANRAGRSDRLSRSVRVKRRLRAALGHDIVANGRAWASSARELVAFEQWTRATGVEHRHLALRYEDVVADPVTAGRRLCAHAGLDVDDQTAERMARIEVVGSSFLDASGSEAAKRPNWTPTAPSSTFRPVGRWRAWGPVRRRQFEWVAGEANRSLGYGN